MQHGSLTPPHGAVAQGQSTHLIRESLRVRVVSLIVSGTCLKVCVGELANGRPTDFDSVRVGSNPTSPATLGSGVIGNSSASEALVHGSNPCFPSTAFRLDFPSTAFGLELHGCLRPPRRHGSEGGALAGSRPDKACSSHGRNGGFDSSRDHHGFVAQWQSRRLLSAEVSVQVRVNPPKPRNTVKHGVV